ncbi:MULTISPECIES: histidine phosphatase family protein [unclassified Cupriavidus]|uniref:histidine phosphatase family protein n=1 Tax=unclassified Cupriavidus TaxID=2640874 RepID=UPI001C0082F6|nr:MULTISPECIES: histidine phosphatase family protein [unclassified Cupriavidus]MCA3183806.1 histidine phosphatase family protein [Cupriavidus sp.]MCA3188535.1 histidine phosphatase family protein [Cupriavidus sp.]MCA3199525.1 histidine phosphatase family protein [Cupriavidus sp.]MCA3204456.1 histidine phosphatase family protein [Cupriavidus sp.]MCA3206044.1 histidine phosphatase family protein [Cupriavidus sp.]
MATLFLVRHGQASFGAANYDCLSDVGRQQARWLGEYFASRGIAFKRVVAGSLVRQQDTATEILNGMGAAGTTVETHTGLNEYDGEALYRSFTNGADHRAHQNGDYQDYWRTFRAAFAAWTQDQLTGMPESWGEFGARMQAALSTATEGAAREDALLVVSSGGAIGRAVADLLGAPTQTAIELNLQFRNTGFCELIVGRGTQRLLSFNNVPHLEHPERRRAITFA